MEPKILKEANDFLVIVKPSGWISNNASTTANTPVLQTWVKNNIKSELADNDKLRSGIVHRLDKETSGLIIVAKNEKAFRSFQYQFKRRKVKKTYVTLLHGKVDQENGEIDAPTGRLPWNRERFGVFPGGKRAVTEYKVIKYYCKDAKYYSLVEVHPKTGRTHQIRIHMKYLGYPVVSDTFYAGRKTSRDDRKWCPRLFLHAESISFANPNTGKVISYKSELPKDLSECLEKLGKEGWAE